MERPTATLKSPFDRFLVTIIGAGLLCLCLAGLAALAWTLTADRVSLDNTDTLEIATAPNPLLQETAETIGNIDETVQQIAASLTSTMEKAEAAGLAAPQVGLSKRIIVVTLLGHLDQDEVLVMVNPEIIHRSGSKWGVEGCESICGMQRQVDAWVSRSERVTVSYRTLEGVEAVREEQGWNARVIQHEVDHLDGVLITDIAPKFHISTGAVAALLVFALALFIRLARSFVSKRGGS
jgi:peptide deformylase